MRVAGLIWSAEFDSTHLLWNGYMHVADCLLTFLSTFGWKHIFGIDEIDLWSNKIFNKNTYKEDTIEFDDNQGFASIISGDYKLLSGITNPANTNYQEVNLRGVIDKESPHLKAWKGVKHIQLNL